MIDCLYLFTKFISFYKKNDSKLEQVIFIYAFMYIQWRLKVGNQARITDVSGSRICRELFS